MRCVAGQHTLKTPGPRWPCLYLNAARPETVADQVEKAGACLVVTL